MNATLEQVSSIFAPFCCCTTLLNLYQVNHTNNNLAKKCLLHRTFDVRSVRLPTKIAETQAWKDARSLQPTIFLPNGTVSMELSLHFSIAWLHSHDLIISEGGTIPGLDVVVSEDGSRIEDGPQFDQSVLIHDLHRHFNLTNSFTKNQQCRIMYEFVGLSITADQWRQPGMTRSPALRGMPK